MRNYFAIAFTCVYLTLTVGVAKTTHYCMGREKHSSLFSFSTKKCPCSLSAKEKMPCCDDQHKLVKIEDDQSGGQVLDSPTPHFNLLGEIHQSPVLTTNYEVQFSSRIEIRPPPPKVPRYQAFCSLVFYNSLA